MNMLQDQPGFGPPGSPGSDATTPGSPPPSPRPCYGPSPPPPGPAPAPIANIQSERSAFAPPILPRATSVDSPASSDCVGLDLSMRGPDGSTQSAEGRPDDESDVGEESDVSVGEDPSGEAPDHR